MNLAKHESERLKQILIKDKIKDPERFSMILKKETENFLNNYFESVPDSLKVEVGIDDDGCYSFFISGKASRVFFCL